MKPLSTIIAIALLVAILELKSVTFVEFRLGTDIFPSRYIIEITPYIQPGDAKPFTFYGQTSIYINCRNTSVREFAVHASGLHFLQVRVYTVDDDRPIPFTYFVDELTEKVVFRLEENLREKMDHSLNFKFTGKITDGYDGLYRRKYINEYGVEKVMVATHLQHTNARKLFPCFDEPVFKAFYDIRISRPKGYAAYTNTLLKSSEMDSYEKHRIVDTFHTLHSMSTFVLSIVVSEFIPRGEDNIYILARPDFYNMTEFSYLVAKDLINGYNGLFGLEYHAVGNRLLQMVAVPKLKYGDVENWGLMIYDEDVLIYENEDNELSSMQYTKTVISHEISHNWFGNSITCAWWGFYWLNEGFARYYEYFGTHEVFPQFELDKQFVVDKLHYVFNLDDVNTTQPLSEPDVATSTDIARKTGEITCAKGAAVIRMISHAMTKPGFDMMISEYIKEHLDTNVIPADMLAYMILYWPEPQQELLVEFFNDWTEQVGYPMLTVVLSDDNRNVKVLQSRYATYNDGSDQKIRYTIPLTYTTSKKRDFENTLPIKYFKKNQNDIIFKFSEPIDWIIFNIQQSGYYRVMYSTNLWYRLRTALMQKNWSDIHEINRAQYVDDLLSYGKVGLFDYDLVFNWLEYLQTETQYTPWKAAFNGFEYISQVFTVEENEEFGKFILFATEKVFKKLGVTGSIGEPVLDVYTRKLIVNSNCKYGRVECINEVQRLMSDYIVNGTAIPIDMRTTVYCNAIKNGTDDDFDKLFMKYELVKSRREKLRIRYGLGCARFPRSVLKFFDFVLSDEVPAEEKDNALEPLYTQNQENAWVVFNFIVSEFEETAKALESWTNLAKLIRKVACRLTTREHKAALKEFIRDNRKLFRTSAHILDDAFATLDYNLKWSQGYLGPLRKYLQTQAWKNVATTNFINILIIALAALSYVSF